MSKGRRTRAGRADKQHRRAARPNRPRPALDVPSSVTDGSVTDAELTTVELIAAAMGGLSEQPACPGPLLVHADGAFECHGPDCPGGTVVFHSEDVIDPCHTRPEVAVRHACSRCTMQPGRPATAGLAVGPGGMVCGGQQIEHDDGGVECSAGDACLGDDVLHASSRSCRFAGPCLRNCRPTWLRGLYHEAGGPASPR
jgi:hypothetical protein